MSIVLRLVGLVMLVFAAVDFLGGFGLLYCRILGVFGLVFLAVSGSV